MKCFVINLKRSTDRRIHIQQQANTINLPIEFIDAVDGNSLTSKELTDYVDHFEESALTKGEVGCALSHLSIYKLMAEHNLPFALIMEDDAILSADLPEVLMQLEQKNSANIPSVHLLTKTIRYIESKSTPLSSRYKITTTLDAYGGYGYVINLAAAKNLLKFACPLRWETDNWKLFSELKLVSVKNIVPPLITLTAEDTIASTLEHERKVQRTKRTEIIRQLRAKRPINIKLKKLLWKIFIKPFLSIVKTQNI